MISWVPTDKGGRAGPPPGPRYVAPAQFDNGPGTDDRQWSLVVDFIRTFAGGRYTYADVQFLVPEAPHGRLTDGGRFGLYEGRRLVATGLIRESQLAPVRDDEFEASLLR